MTGGTTLLADSLKPEERGRVLGYFQTFQLIGSAAGLTIGGLVASIWSMRAPFYFYSFLALVSFFLSLALIHESGYLKKRRPSLEFSQSLIQRILKIKEFNVACLATFNISFLTAGLRNTIIPLYADYIIGLEEVQIGMVLIFANLCNMVLTIPMGYMIDYHGRKSVILKSLYVTSAASILFAFSSDFLTMSLVALVFGIGTSVSQQAPLAMATDVTKTSLEGCPSDCTEYSQM